MDSNYLGAAWEGKVSSSLALGEGVYAVPDCTDQYSNDNNRDNRSSLALFSDFLKHSLLASLGQSTTSRTLSDNALTQKSAPGPLLIFSTRRIILEMVSIILARIINSTIWIVSGLVVIIIRTFIIQGGSVLLWQTIGGGMMVYGALRLVWTLVKTSSTSATSV